MRILEIDDNVDITKFVEMVATSLGHDFSSVDNGKDGVRMIEENQYDMVLLDLAMPEFSGIDVLDALTEKGLAKKQKIVLFTASIQTIESVEELKQKGAHSHILKPIDIDALMAKFAEIESQL